MMSLERISEIKNGKEKKRNPRKGKKQKEVPHPLHLYGKDKESTSLCHFWRRSVPM